MGITTFVSSRCSFHPLMHTPWRQRCPYMISQLLLHVWNQAGNQNATTIITTGEWEIYHINHDLSYLCWKFKWELTKLGSMLDIGEKMVTSTGIILHPLSYEWEGSTITFHPRLYCQKYLLGGGFNCGVLCLSITSNCWEGWCMVLVSMQDFRLEGRFMVGIIRLAIRVMDDFWLEFFFFLKKNKNSASFSFLHTRGNNGKEERWPIGGVNEIWISDYSVLDKTWKKSRNSYIS